MKVLLCFLVSILVGVGSSLLAFGQLGAGDANGRLNVTVADAAEGAPIAYAYVLIHPDGEDKDLVSKVNRQGEFNGSLAPGLYDVLVSATGFSPICQKIEITRGKTTNIRGKLRPDEEHLQPSRR